MKKILKKAFFGVLTIFVFFSTFARDFEIFLYKTQNYVSSLEKFSPIEIYFGEEIVDFKKYSEKEIESLNSFITIEPQLKVKYEWLKPDYLRIKVLDLGEVSADKEYIITVKKGLKSLKGNELKNDKKFVIKTHSLFLLNARELKPILKDEKEKVLILFFNFPVVKEDMEGCVSIKGGFPKPEFVSDYLKFLEKERANLDSNALLKFEEKIKKCFNEEIEPISFDFLNENDPEVRRILPKGECSLYEKRFLVLKLKGTLEKFSTLYVSSNGKGSRCFGGNITIGLYNPNEPFFFKELTYSEQSYSVEEIDLEENVGLSFTQKVSLKELLQKIKVYDLENKREIEFSKEVEEDLISDFIPLNMLKFKKRPEKRYLVRIDETLQSINKESLGYPAYAIFKVKISKAKLSLFDYEGICEASKGTKIPYLVRNVSKVVEKFLPLNKEELIGFIKSNIGGNDYYERNRELVKGDYNFIEKVRDIKNLELNEDLIVETDLKEFLNEKGRGLIFIQIEPYMNNLNEYEDSWDIVKKSIIQVTDLGIFLKYSPNDALVFITYLSTGEPVPFCNVEIRDLENKILFKGQTDEKGVLRIKEKIFKGEWLDLNYIRNFFVFAEKDGDFSYISNDFNEGLKSWELGIETYGFDSDSDLKGLVFTDRGIYRLGEEVLIKGILRYEDRDELKLFPKDEMVLVEIFDSRNKKRGEFNLKLNEYGSFNLKFKIEEEYPLGYYSIKVTHPKGFLKKYFYVTSFRKPEFKVVTELKYDENQKKAKCSIKANYLNGLPVAGGKLKYFYYIRAEERWLEKPLNFDENYLFNSFEDSAQEVSGNGEATLNESGYYEFFLNIEKKPYTQKIIFEAEVTDITNQVISNSSSISIKPDYFLGINYDYSFKGLTEPIKRKIVLLNKDGNFVENIEIEVIVEKEVYKSSRYSTGYRFYDWYSVVDYERVGSFSIKSSKIPVEIEFKVPSGGDYRITAKAFIDGIQYIVREWEWVYGEGYTPWERKTSKIVNLITEKKEYKPFEKFKAILLSPWEKAIMLVTKERETILDYRVEQINSTQPLVESELNEKDIPNVYISAAIFKRKENKDDKAEMRIGYANVKVLHDIKKLKVNIETDKKEYEPKETVSLKVNVRDNNDQPLKGVEVTLWAVDEGILMLTNYKTPNPEETFYSKKALKVFMADSREKIITARVKTPKGEESGGGGGKEFGNFDQVRRDFRFVAFYCAAEITDENGNIFKNFEVPDSLTTFKIMVVAQTKDNQFGWGESTFLVFRDFMLTPYFPRFLLPQDEGYLKVLVQSKSEEKAECYIKLESLTPDILRVEEGEIRGEVYKKREFRFKVKALNVGKGKIRVIGNGFGKSDAFEVELNVLFPLRERVEKWKKTFTERDELKIGISDEIDQNIGNLKIVLSPLTLTEVFDAYQYVVSYPYGCAEQRSSKLYALINEFRFARMLKKLDDVSLKETRRVLEKEIAYLQKFQKEDGGFSLWEREKNSYGYLSAYIGNLLNKAKKEGIKVDDNMFLSLLGYLKESLKKERENEKYDLFFALAVKVLAESGEDVDNFLNMAQISSNKTFSYLCYLWDAAIFSKNFIKADKIKKVIDLKIGQSPFLPQYLYFNCDKETEMAILLDSLCRNGGDRKIVEELVGKLLESLKKATANRYYWNTHKSAHIFNAFATYVEIFESVLEEIPYKIEINNSKIFKGVLSKRNSYLFKEEIPLKAILQQGVGNIEIDFKTDSKRKVYAFVFLKSYPKNYLERGVENGIKIVRKVFDLKSNLEKTSFKEGDLVEVSLTLESITGKELDNVLVVDPIPAGFEIIDTTLKTASIKLSNNNTEQEYGYYFPQYFDKYDDKVLLFYGRVGSLNRISFKYAIRVTQSGKFIWRGPVVICMYDEAIRCEEEGSIVEIKKE